MLDAASKSGDIDEEDNKVIELVLKGVNIILMKTANTVDSDLNRVLDQQIDILFRLTHHKVFRIQLQTLKLLFQFAKSSAKFDKVNV